MDNDQLRKELLRYLDDLLVQEGITTINSRGVAENLSSELGVELDPQRVKKALQYLMDNDKPYIDSDEIGSMDKPHGSDYIIRRVTAAGRDFLEGKSNVNSDVNFNVGDINADMVAIGQNISQEKIVEVSRLKDEVDGTKGLSREEKENLKERIDQLEGELQKPNPDKAIIGSILKQIREKGTDALIGLTASHLFQQFILAVN